MWLDGEACQLRWSSAASSFTCSRRAGHVRIDRLDPLVLAEAEDEADGALSAPMPGKIVRQPVAAGDRVARGTPLLVLEAMKMEHTIIAPSEGQILRLHYRRGRSGRGRRDPDRLRGDAGLNWASASRRLQS